MTLTLVGAQAQTKDSDKPASGLTLTSNVAIVSQYIFRGITYSQRKPAIQGGFDLSHQSGWYLGVWAGSLSAQAISGAAVELDAYGGYTTTVGDYSYDVGILRFAFPGSSFNGQSYTTWEAYGSVGYKQFKLKYSHALTDFFGMNRDSMGYGRNSKGSHYLEANFSHPFGHGVSGHLHVGRQWVSGYPEFNFTDYKVELTKEFDGGWLIGLAAVDTNASASLYRINGVNTYGFRWLATLKRTF